MDHGEHCHLDVIHCAQCCAAEHAEYVVPAGQTCGPCGIGEHDLCWGCACTHNTDT